MCLVHHFFLLYLNPEPILPYPFLGSPHYNKNLGIFYQITDKSPELLIYKRYTINTTMCLNLKKKLIIILRECLLLFISIFPILNSIHALNAYLSVYMDIYSCTHMYIYVCKNRLL